MTKKKAEVEMDRRSEDRRDEHRRKSDKTVAEDRREDDRRKVLRRCQIDATNNDEIEFMQQTCQRPDVPDMP